MPSPGKRGHPSGSHGMIRLRTLPCWHSILPAAPPAVVRPSMWQIAAADGECQHHTHYDRNQYSHDEGCCSVAHIITCPTDAAAVPIGARSVQKRRLRKYGHRGVTRYRSSFLRNRLAYLRCNNRYMSTASGPPAPPSWFAEYPTAARKTVPAATFQSEAYCNGHGRPDISVANLPSFRNPSLSGCRPYYRPMSSEQNRPCAMALMASMA